MSFGVEVKRHEKEKRCGSEEGGGEEEKEE